MIKRTFETVETKTYYDICKVGNELYCFPDAKTFSHDCISLDNISAVVVKAGKFIVKSKPIKWSLDLHHTQAMKGKYHYRRIGKLMYCKPITKGLLIEKIC